MLSTLLNYRLYSADMTKTLARIGSDAGVERDAAYYKANIGKVGSVDDLMGDYRLYSYALKAYGLSEQISSPAFVRKILESDLSDSASFANRLSDPRYRTLAAAFDFSAAGAETTIQSQAQTDRLVEAYSDHLVRGGALAAGKAQTFQTTIASVATVDELLADTASFEMLAKIAGLDPAIASRSFLRAVLTDTSQGGPALSDGLQFLKDSFEFGADGRSSAVSGAQTASQTAQFITRYFAAAGQATSPQAAAFEGRYFETAALKAAKVEDLVDDPTSFKVLRLAAGLPDGTAPRAALVNLFTLPADDANNPIAKLTGNDPATVAQREKLIALKGTFDFENGSQTAPASDSARVSRLLTSFYEGYPKIANDSTIALRTNSFRVQLSGMKSINDLLGRDPVYARQAFDFVLKAFDLDPATESTAKIRAVLTSDPSDPASYVSKLKDERYEKLAAAFNFGADGKARPERLAQSVRAQQETATLFSASFGADQSEAQKADIRKQTVAYLEGVGGVSSLDGLLSNKTVLNYALKAQGLDGETLSSGDLRKLLTSDLSDPASFARAKNDNRYVDFVSSFNFEPDGRIQMSGASVQDAGSLLSTQNLYVLQMLEEQAGATSEGTRLALYFLRKSPDIRNAFSILADKALFEVARTALGLPAQISQLDIDRQAKILESRLDMADFQDAKALDKFIARFATLYDMNNGTGGASDPLLALFGGGGQSGLSGLL